MATKSENADIAVLQTQMTSVESDVTDIKKDVKTILENLDTTYVKKNEFKAFKWTTIPITIVATVVITFLATSFLQSLNKPNDSARDTVVNPSTSTTTTTTTPTGSTSTTESDGTTGTSTPQTQQPAVQPSNDNGGVDIDLPKVR